jgi:phosphoglycolate phosphatase
LSFDGVIFDLDGTLADTLADIADSMNQALSEYGVPAIAVERYKDLCVYGQQPEVPHKPTRRWRCRSRPS